MLSKFLPGGVIYIIILFAGMQDFGSFWGKGIKTQFQTLKKCDDNILDAFANFGTTLQVPENIITQMQRFVCLLYGDSPDKSIKGNTINYFDNIIDLNDRENLF